MQAIAGLTPRWVILPLLAGVLVLPATLPAQQAERYTITGDEVAIYNLAGEVKVEQGGGPGVTAEVTRGGGDAAKLKVVSSEVNGRRSLRFIYPGDKIQYGKLDRGLVHPASGAR